MAATIFWALKSLQITSDSCCDSHIFSSDKLKCHHDAKSVHDKKEDKQLDYNNNDNDENVKPTYSRSSVSDHCTYDSCWIIINNKVYDVTRFLRLHPGGEDIILEYGGCDATVSFIDKGHSNAAYGSLAAYLIGEVTQEDRWPEKRVL